MYVIYTFYWIGEAKYKDGLYSKLCLIYFDSLKDRTSLLLDACDLLH